MSGDDETKRLLPKTDREHLIMLDGKVRGHEKELAGGNRVMQEMQETQNHQNIILERVNNKASLSLWAMGVCGAAIIVGIVALILQPAQKQSQQPIEIQLVMPDDKP